MDIIAVKLTNVCIQYAIELCHNLWFCMLNFKLAFSLCWGVPQSHQQRALEALGHWDSTPLTEEVPNLASES